MYFIVNCPGYKGSKMQALHNSISWFQVKQLMEVSSCNICDFFCSRVAKKKLNC